MSVVVLGMKLPEDCDSCWVPGNRCNLWIGVGAGERHRDCPLRPLPDGHGRLIDANAFEEFVQGKWEQNEISNGDWMSFREWSRDQETIIEAEGV